jgi:hypothetical protein
VGLFLCIFLHLFPRLEWIPSAPITTSPLNSLPSSHFTVTSPSPLTTRYILFHIDLRLILQVIKHSLKKNNPFTIPDCYPSQRTAWTPITNLNHSQGSPYISSTSFGQALIDTNLPSDFQKNVHCIPSLPWAWSQLRHPVAGISYPELLGECSRSLLARRCGLALGLLLSRQLWWLWSFDRTWWISFLWRID